MSNVQVAVRARPLNQRELDMDSKVAVEMRNKSTILFKTVSGIAVGETRDDSKEFEYDHSYWSVDSQDTHFITQEQVYNDLGKSVLESAFQGYNACVFAYGQTGSGKTHTMMGSEEDPGLIPRICESLYAHIETGSKRNVSYRVEASYMEIYNEKVRDLLQASTPGRTQDLHRLKVREHPKEGPYVENLSRSNVGDFQEISKLMKIGNSHRVTASTKMNDVSSRSHAIFTILFTQAAYSSDLPCETVSKIHLVDLAGSERASATGAEGLRLKEGGNINRSLACLGNVISALADMSSHVNRGKKTFIPYRDSVLTWLLKDSLGGNSKTIMVATISPAVANYGETLSTLRYASRAKNIVNKPVVNEDANVKLIRELRTEIKRLKAIITAAKLQDSDLIGPDSLLEENIHKKEEMIAELTKSWAGKWDQGIQQLVEESNLALHSEGIKMTLASERPHLLAVDNDVLGGGVVIYHLKNGVTTIGVKDTSPLPDIALSGCDIEAQHCSVENSEDQVRLVLADGKCYVNHHKVLEDQDLSHGDHLQLGETTVFRFNHPEEAQRLKAIVDSRRGGALLPLSPISPAISDDSHDRTAEDFEEQREALEKDYNEKMERLRETLEKERAEDRAKFLQEIEALRQQNMHTPSSDTEGDVRRNTTYELLQSIAFSPIGPDIADRIVVGEERGQDINSPHFSLSPDCAHSYQSSVMSSTPGSSPRDVIRRTSIAQEQVDEDTLEISLVDKEERFRVDSKCEDNGGYCVVDNLTKEGEGEEQDGGGASPQSVRGERESRSRQPSSDEDLKLKATETKLQEKEREFEEVLEEKLEVESQLSEANRRALSLRHHLSEKEYQLQSNQDEWEKKLQTLEYQLATRDLDSSMRVRSNAMSQSDTLSVDGRPRRRKKRQRSQSASRSMRRPNPPFLVEVPGCLLRGQGWGSYHVYEVRVQLSAFKWSVFKSYAQFKIFREDMVKRYSQLSVLAFPPSKWIGVRNAEFVERRRMDLQNFMQSLLAICATLPTCPLYDLKHMTKDRLYTFSSFFDPGTRTGL